MDGARKEYLEALPVEFSTQTLRNAVPFLRLANWRIVACCASA